MIDVLARPELCAAAATQPAATTPVPEAADRLVARLRHGDAGAFEALYRQLVSGVYGLAVRLARDRAEAEELTQEAFVRAWEARSRFDSLAHLRNWLRRVTVNEWIDRTRKRRDVPLDEDDRSAAAGRLATPPPSPGARLDLARALALLSPRLRAVLVLFDLYGLDHGEIGATLGMTAGASKVQLHRARRRLRELLP